MAGSYPVRGPLLFSLTLEGLVFPDVPMLFTEQLDNFGVLGRNTLDAGMTVAILGAPVYQICLGYTAG